MTDNVNSHFPPATPGLLMSIALRLDHAIGMPGYYDQEILGGKPGDHARRLEMLLSDARRAYEEITGTGFYSPDKEAAYASMAEAAKGQSNG